MNVDKLFNLVFCFILLITPFQIGAQQFPKPVGYVNDFADVIPGDTEQQITAICQELEQKTQAEIAVVNMPSIGDEDYMDYANRLFEAWGIGKRGEDNGVLIFNAIQERKIKIEVGYGLEGILPDGKVGQIIDDYLIQHLKAGNYGQAYLNAVIIVAQIIAEDAGVQLTGDMSTSQRSNDRSRGFGMGKLFTILFFIFLVIITRGRILPWLIFGAMSGGGRGRDDWGGFGRGGGFGGGFGGFGGGMSGGGGAGRSY